MADSKRLLTRIAHRVDTTANWTSADPVLLKGELAITIDAGETPKIKIGVDGVKTWSQIDYTYDITDLLASMTEIAEEKASAAAGQIGNSVYVDSDLTNITGQRKGDIAVISTTISGDKVSKTAYTYSGTEWVAMDGNYNAENVYFEDDFLVTNSVGAFTVSGASTTLEAAGKNVKQIFETLLTKEDSANLKKTNPSVSISTSNQNVEVGTTVTPSVTVSFSDGQYKYGPEPTGVTATTSTYKITNNKVNSEEITGATTGTFADYKFPVDPTTYQVTVSVDHSAGFAPVSNTGNEYAAQAFAAGSKTATKTIYTSYKPNFYGYVKADGKLDITSASDASKITSDFVRGLQNNQGATTAPVTTYTIPESWIQFFYAVPSGRKSSLEGKDLGTGLPLAKAVKCENVSVNHAGGLSSNYTVFVISNAVETDGTNIELTWA